MILQQIRIREAGDSDLNDVLCVERMAFGRDEEAELVRELLRDPSAKPILSLLAFKDDLPVGHILFTKAHLEHCHNPAIEIAILAPLAIVPDAQKRGIGGKLIKTGLELLSKSGVGLVFVLGHPEYYPKHGFQPAGCLGFETPYSIPQENAIAWMVQALRPEIIGSVFGKVICANTLNKPEYWRE